MESLVHRREDLYRRVTTTLDGRYRPLDGVPFFRFLYPPELELEVLEEFRLFVRRLRSNGYTACTISLVEALRAALTDLLGSHSQDLYERLRAFESMYPREEAARLLSHQLPDAVASTLIEQLQSTGPPACAVLTRAPALFPFVRVSSLLGRLEGRTRSVLVVPCYRDEEAATLRAQSYDTVLGYYRGEII